MSNESLTTPAPDESLTIETEETTMIPVDSPEEGEVGPVDDSEPHDGQASLELNLVYPDGPGFGEFMVMESATVATVEGGVVILGSIKADRQLNFHAPLDTMNRFLKAVAVDQLDLCAGRLIIVDESNQRIICPFGTNDFAQVAFTGDSSE